MEENVSEKKENITANNNKNSSKMGIVVALIIISILLIGVGVYFVFIKKDNSSDTPKPQDNSEVTTRDISVKKSLEVFAFNVILDTNGNAYLDLREDNIDKESYSELVELFNSAETYNYDNKSEKLVKLNAQNIKDIQTLDFGNGGGKYIILLDKNDKLYALIDYKIEESGDISLLTSNELNKVTKVYSECDSEACIVYADAVINGKTEKISLYELFENDENETTLTNYNRKVELGDESVQMKLVDGSIYLNDKKVKSGKYSYINVLAMDKFIILQNGVDEIIGFVNENKEFIDKNYGSISNIHYEDSNYSIIGMMLDNEKYKTVKIEYAKTKLNIYDTVLRQELIANSKLAVIFNNKSIYISVDDNNLYLNNTIIKSFKSDEENTPDKIYVMDKYILLVWQGGQCAGGVIVGAINENYEYIDVVTNGYVNIYGIRIENGKILAKAEVSDKYDYCGSEEAVELVYNVKDVTMQKAK